MTLANNLALSSKRENMYIQYYAPSVLPRKILFWVARKYVKECLKQHDF